MQKTLLFTLALTLCGAAIAQPPMNPTADVQKEIELLERQRFEAQVNKDFPALERLFADDLVYTHANGHQDSKATYIQSIREGKSQYDKIVVEALNVRAYNDGKTAVVNGLVLITLPNKPDGTANLAYLKYVVVQVKDLKKGWQVVLWQSQKQAA